MPSNTNSDAVTAGRPLRASVPSAEEATTLRRIAWCLAMIDQWHSTEHDEALFDEARGMAEKWHAQFAQSGGDTGHDRQKTEPENEG